MNLVPIDSVRPSTYNPRSADPRRLDLVALSLRKLGFVLPLSADAGGELLSGHQRHLVAQRLGLTHVPVGTVVGLEVGTFWSPTLAIIPFTSSGVLTRGLTRWFATAGEHPFPEWDREGMRRRSSGAFSVMRSITNNSPSLPEAMPGAPRRNLSPRSIQRQVQWCGPLMLPITSCSPA